MNLQRSHAEGRQQREIGGAQPTAGGQHTLTLRNSRPGCRCSRRARSTAYRDGPFANGVRVLDHHDAVGTLGDEAARGDGDRLPRPDASVEYGAHRHGADDVQRRRRLGAGAGEVGGPHGVAVHHGAALGGKIRRCCEGAGQDPPGGVRQRMRSVPTARVSLKIRRASSAGRSVRFGRPRRDIVTSSDGQDRPAAREPGYGLWRPPPTAAAAIRRAARRRG